MLRSSETELSHHSQEVAVHHLVLVLVILGIVDGREPAVNYPLDGTMAPCDVIKTLPLDTVL